MRRFFVLLCVFTLCFISCKEDVLPKPKGYLSLKYPINSYEKLTLARPYTFQVSNNATVVDQPKLWMKIKYPKLKATIDITYLSIQNNLKELLVESEKLVYKHAVKAAQITAPRDFVNRDKKVFGSLYEITGDAASQIQFHATDSVANFIKGALSFYAKPNYDSIYPAANYLQNDVRRIMETLKWNE